MSDATRPSDEELYEAYVCLLARALVARQERTDLSEDGVEHNVIKYNPVGQADFVNPNLDVAYLEAWVAVDDATPVTLTVPRVEGRYYTAQLASEWGDVIANVNERTMPEAPYGDFVLHAPGSPPPAGAGTPIELASRKAKLLGRVEIAGDLQGAVALQHAFRLSVAGSPRVEPPLALPDFDNASLLGAEVFDHAEALLTSPPDPVATLRGSMPARVRAVAAYVASGTEARAEVDRRVREDVVPRARDEATTKVLRYQDGWLAANELGRYGDRYHVRMAVNLVGIWGNDAGEVVYYVGTRDAAGTPYRGGVPYALTFPADSLPSAHAAAYWSIILVDVPDFRVVPNAIDRYNLNSHSPLAYELDGSLRIDITPEPVPGRPASNWLPSPAQGAFSLTLRLYVPGDAPLAGEWFPPALRATGPGGPA